MSNAVPIWVPVVESSHNVPALIGDLYVLVATASLFFYDYVLLLPSEIRVVWRTPVNIASIFYLSIRYGFFLQLVITLLQQVHISPTVGPNLSPGACQGLLDVLIVLNLLNFCLISAFVATRIYAMHARNWYLAIFMFLLGSLSPCSVTQAFGFYFQSVPAPWPYPACLSYLSDTSPVSLVAMRDLPIALSSLSVLYEIICLYLTVSKTLGLYRAQRRTGIPTTLTSLLLRDGALYFGAVLILSVLNINAVLTKATKPNSRPLDIDIARVTIPILTTRFILHLKEIGRDEAVMSNSASSYSYSGMHGNRLLASGGTTARVDFHQEGIELHDKRPRMPPIRSRYDSRHDVYAADDPGPAFILPKTGIAV